MKKLFYFVAVIALFAVASCDKTKPATTTTTTSDSSSVHTSTIDSISVKPK